MGAHLAGHVWHEFVEVCDLTVDVDDVGPVPLGDDRAAAGGSGGWGCLSELLVREKLLDG